MMANAALGERVAQTLSGNPYFQGRHLRIEAQEGHVKLHGEVSSYFHKQMAQEVLRRVDGVNTIENHLRVSWPQLDAASLTDGLTMPASLA